MRFSTKAEAYQWFLDHKEQIRDRFNITDFADLKAKIIQWFKRHRHMFGDVEWARMRENIDDINLKDALFRISELADWAENKPRRTAVIVIVAAAKAQANAKAKKLDEDVVDIFTQGLSANGNEPASHYMCRWNCASSTYDWLVAQAHNPPQSRVIDGDLYTDVQILGALGLQKIVIQLEL